MIEPIKTSFYNNLQRVRDLTQLHLALQSFPAQNSILYSEDVLRASIVLMHASMEDLIRGIFRWIMPTRGAEEWNKIPLKGLDNRNQPKAFLLGKLFEYKTMSVHEVVHSSIEEYLNYTNYNKVEDIVSVFIDLGIDKTQFQDNFQLLNEMMGRRHKIVHQADREVDLNSPEQSLRSIEYTLVVAYLENLSEFGEKIFNYFNTVESD